MKATKNGARRGGALLEFALAGPLLLLILFGTADFGQIFAGSVMLQRAARAGTQYATLDQARWTDYTAIQNAAMANIYGLTGPSATALRYCSCGWNGENNCASSCSGQRMYIRVTVQATFNTVVTYPGIPSSTALSASSTLRLR